MTESIKDDMREHQHEWCKNPIDDKYYYAFVLGYDLLQDKFMKYHGEDAGGSYPCESDACFDICLYLAEKFKQSVEYVTMDCSAYDALQAWLENYSEFIDEVTSE